MQEDHREAPAAEIARGELPSAGIHNEVCRVLVQAAGDGAGSLTRADR